MFKKIDQLLRLDSQSAGGDKEDKVSTSSLLQIIFLLGIIYGAFMGLYTLMLQNDFEDRRVRVLQMRSRAAGANRSVANAT